MRGKVSIYLGLAGCHSTHVSKTLIGAGKYRRRHNQAIGDYQMTDTKTTTSNDKANSNEAPVLSFEGLTATPGNTVQVQPRTMRLPKPATFYFEPASPRRKNDEGNSHDQISKGVHQVDPTRRVSCTPVMPNLDMLKKDGNPYPKSASHETVKTSPTWQPFVEVQRATYMTLKKQKEPIKLSDLITAVMKITKVGRNDDGSPGNKAKKCIRDTVRDLRTYGIAVSNGPGYGQASLWQLVSDPSKVETL